MLITPTKSSKQLSITYKTRKPNYFSVTLVISTKRASKLGDIVVIDFKGTVDGEAFDGGSAEGHQLELGSNQFIPGFEDQLIGKKVGSALKVKVTFPDPYSQPALAGKGAVFETKVVEIREPVSVEINDDFAKLFVNLITFTFQMWYNTACTKPCGLYIADKTQTLHFV